MCSLFIGTLGIKLDHSSSCSTIFCVITCWCFVFAVFCISVCDQRYESTSGSIISSPNYPNNYPNDASCHYLIALRDPTLRITLNFQQFSLEESSSCAFDSVRIYDGDSDTAPQLGYKYKYCGNRLPPSLTSTGNKVLIVFTSDSLATASGFLLTYRGEPF